eukprot:434739-Amphidinium_carterae.2
MEHADFEGVFETLPDAGAEQNGRESLGPDRPPVRSKPYMAMLRLVKQNKNLKRKQQCLQGDDAGALEQAWNQEFGLREGDRACGSASSAGRHPNTWNLIGLLNTAWKEIGGTRAAVAKTLGSLGVGRTRRAVQALLLTAVAYKER